MSVDFYLTDPVTGNTLDLPEGERLEAEGGTYCLGGWTTCELNITYNYGKCYAVAAQRAGIIHYPGMLRWLDGRRAHETLPELEAVIAHLDTNISEDYWEGTEGNARHALTILARFARAHPNGQWIAEG